MPDHEVTVVVPTEDRRWATEFVRDAVRRAGHRTEVDDRGRVVVAGPVALADNPPVTAADVTAAISLAFRHALNTGRVDHVVGFYRQRPAGSQWGRHIPGSVNAWASGVAWREVQPEWLPPGAALPGCRYLRTNDAALLDGAVEHVGLSPALDRGLIFAAKDVHGWALFTTEPLPKQSATEAWMILGPASPVDPVLIPWTAFPGRLAAAPPPDWDGDLLKLDLQSVPYGVKQVTPEAKAFITSDPEPSDARTEAPDRPE